jgi:O-antigen ligase
VTSFLVAVTVLTLVCGAALAFPAVYRRPAFAVFLLFALFPFGLHKLAGVQVVQLAALGVAATVAFVRLSRGASPLGWTNLLWGPLALAGLAVLGTPGGIDPAFAQKQDATMILGLLLVCAVVGAVRTMADVRMILLAFLVAGDIVCLNGVLGARAVTVKFAGAVVDNRAQGMFDQPNAFGSFCAAVLCVALGLLLTRQSRRVRVFAGISAAIAAIAVALSLSRGAVIGAALAVIGFAVVLPKIRWRILGSTAAVVVCLLVAGGSHIGPVQAQVFGTRLTTLFSGNDNPNDKRTAAWAEAFREIQARPLLGFGPNGFPEASAGAPGIGAAGTDFPELDRPVGIDHAHNVILTVAAELGLVAAFVLVAFSLALGLKLKKAIRLRPPADAGVVIACAAGLLSFVGHGIVDYTFANAMVVMPLYLVTGCAVAATLIRSPERPRDADPRRAHAVPVGVSTRPALGSAVSTRSSLRGS